MDIQEEVDRNFEAFQRELPNILHFQGKHALMHDGKIINYYDTIGDAISTGRSMYRDNLFSVQLVTIQPVDLGFFSHALSSR